MDMIATKFCQLSDNGNVAEANEVFNEIDKELRPDLKNTVLAMISKKEFRKYSEDIVQEIIFSIFKSLKDPNKRWVANRLINGNQPAIFKTWAYSFIRFKSIDSFRKEKRHFENPIAFEILVSKKVAKGMSPLDIVVCNESIERIYKVIGILPEGKLLIRRLDGFKGVETAREYGMTPVQVSRAEKAVRKILGERIF